MWNYLFTQLTFPSWLKYSFTVEYAKRVSSCFPSIFYILFIRCEKIMGHGKIYWRPPLWYNKENKERAQNKRKYSRCRTRKSNSLGTDGSRTWPFHDDGSNMIISNSTNQPTRHIRHKQHQCGRKGEGMVMWNVYMKERWDIIIIYVDRTNSRGLSHTKGEMFMTKYFPL